MSEVNNNEIKFDINKWKLVFSVQRLVKPHYTKEKFAKWFMANIK